MAVNILLLLKMTIKRARILNYFKDEEFVPRPNSTQMLHYCLSLLWMKEIRHSGAVKQARFTRRREK